MFDQPTFTSESEAAAYLENSIAGLRNIGDVLIELVESPDGSDELRETVKQCLTLSHELKENYNTVTGALLGYAKTEPQREQPVCPDCGSSDITGIAVVRWDSRSWSAEGSEPYEKDFRCENDDCETVDFTRPSWAEE